MHAWRRRSSLWNDGTVGKTKPEIQLSRTVTLLWRPVDRAMCTPNQPASPLGRSGAPWGANWGAPASPATEDRHSPDKNRSPIAQVRFVFSAVSHLPAPRAQSREVPVDLVAGRSVFQLQFHCELGVLV